MKNKRFISVLIILLILILSFIAIMVNLSKNKQTKTENYDFTNKIFSSCPDDEDDTYATIVVFEKNGKYYNFTNTHDEGCILRAHSGRWNRDEDGILYVEYDKAIFYEGGELVEVDEPNYNNVRRNNYTLVKKSYPYNAILKFSIDYDENKKYKTYLTIDDRTYDPIYEFKTEEELQKKLEEMYGVVYTMLVDDTIDVIDDTTYNNENTNE